MFTKGKWQIGFSDGSGPEYIVSGDKIRVAALRWGCSCCKACIDRFEDLSSEEQADACLIAAAPDLLAACKLAKTVLIGLNFKPYGMVMKQLKAAIDKARTPQK